jgi:hypothetical protein
MNKVGKKMKHPGCQMMTAGMFMVSMAGMAEKEQTGEERTRSAPRRSIFTGGLTPQGPFAHGV